MAANAEATREARAKVIAADGEQKASLSLKQAPEVINTSPVANFNDSICRKEQHDNFSSAN